MLTDRSFTISEVYHCLESGFSAIMDKLSQRIANLSPEKLVLLEQRLMKKAAPVAKPQTISRRDLSTPCPLSFSQQRLWFLHQLDPSKSFNISIGIRLDGRLNTSALQQTLDAIVARHEALRTTFMASDENPIQVIADPQSVNLSIVDLSQHPTDDLDATIQNILEPASLYPIDLASELMLRATLLKLNETEHILLLVMHHVASDGWSVGILFRELAEFYTAFSEGNSASLPELSIQYADFAHWQRQWLQGEVLERQINYWKQQLADVPPLLELPTDRPRPAVQTFQGHTIYFQLNTDLSQQLKELSQKSGTTLFMTLLAAFATLLHRYSGQDDIVIGSPIANRHRSEVEPLIGFFINTLALRTRLSDNPSFSQLLQQVRETTLAAYDHQDLPFEKLVEELHPERSLSYSPLFQVMLVLQNAPIGNLELPGLTLTPLQLEDSAARDDLFLSIAETEAGLTGELAYNNDLFDRSTIDRLVGHFQTLLSSIVANPDQPVAQLPLLTAAEQQQMLIQWNDTQVDYPLDQCFPQLFEAQVKRTPDAIAAVYQDQKLTYQQLNDRANQWANVLVQQGVGQESLVALLEERNLDFLTAMLAVFKAGGAYLPLNPQHPSDRIAQVLQQSQVSFLLSSKRLHSLVTISHLQVIDIEDLDTAPAADNLPIRCTPNSLAYVIYTSGSTGQPKGVMLEHRGMLNHLFAKVDTLQLSATDAVAQTAAQTFDISIWQFLVPLLVGGRVEIVPTAIATDAAQLLSLVEQRSISILEVVPSLLLLLVQQLELVTSKPALTSLRWLLLTGEALPPALCQQWFEIYPQIPLLNAYGPTECSDDVSQYPLHEAPKADLLTIPIGHPLPNTQLYILDQFLQSVPVGVAGELYVGGAGVGRGYLHNESQTAQAFVANPFSPEQQLYKSGDKARFRADGSIEFLGRFDDQVKLRGFRIELGEIESVLSQHPAVQAAVVMLREDQPGKPQLVGYVMATEVTPQALRQFLQQQLPDYMIPAAFVQLDSLPVTANGKVNRKALPAPEMSLAADFVAPSTPTQIAIAQVWAEVLKVESVGLHDHFFELGGHSLLATLVLSRLRFLLGLDLPLRCCFEYPTLAALAEFIEQMRSTLEKLQTHSSQPSEDREEIEL